MTYDDFLFKAVTLTKQLKGLFMRELSVLTKLMSMTQTLEYPDRLNKYPVKAVHNGICRTTRHNKMLVSVRLHYCFSDIFFLLINGLSKCKCQI